MGRKKKDKNFDQILDHKKWAEKKKYKNFHQILGPKKGQTKER